MVQSHIVMRRGADDVAVVPRSKPSRRCRPPRPARTRLRARACTDACTHAFAQVVTIAYVDVRHPPPPPLRSHEHQWSSYNQRGRLATQRSVIHLPRSLILHG
eukprot:1673999-Pleurochrysis_carterae.AAC.2